MDVAQETRKHTATCNFRREERTKESREEKRTKPEEKRGLNRAEHSVVKTHCRPLLCCSTLLYSLLFFVWHTAYCPFSLPHSNRGSIPQATDHFKTAFIVARCFFWLQEGLTLPHHSIAEQLVLPTVVWVCLWVCMRVCGCVCVRAYYIYAHVSCLSQS